MSKLKKYPRSFHLPWSRGYTHDDKVAKNVNHFLGKEVVVTEKLDGEGTTLYRDYMHARSINSANHPSRHWVKTFHASFAYRIPNDWRLCGENVYAKHSIYYQALTSYFYLFSIWNEDNICLSWDETIAFAAELGIETVPVLYRGIFDEEKIKRTFTGISLFDGEQEGYVIRNAGSFHYDDFQSNLGKFVRMDHVQTSEHWLQEEVIPNRLK
ncbi:RNA ligase family protein [Lysinibacillus pakistanensis]|nr:RNA ligase family protein [Lysinibacillus pakistanensis]MDM5231019.1 RNA ligase family protein [Lysinibacillus pakistanensis]WHY46581.1 RNA ligase family protein [Lysinibacillus pakistanensis]WHY51594.1 RNA ligase family protein [Lysinibacillus pakistanensis]